MYTAPEQTLSLAGPSKFDVFSVGMTGLRVLFPTFTKGGESNQWPGGRFQQFAEEDFRKCQFDLQTWLEQKATDESEPELAEECAELLGTPEFALVLDVLKKMLNKNVILRASAQDALNIVSCLAPFSMQWKNRDFFMQCWADEGLTESLSLHSMTTSLYIIAACVSSWKPRQYLTRCWCCLGLIKSPGPEVLGQCAAVHAYVMEDMMQKAMKRTHDKDMDE